jgi:hypothetical protein
MPSYESEDGSFQVYDFLATIPDLRTRGMIAASRWYGTACLLAPDGMVPLHHEETQEWKWRPCLYTQHWTGAGWQQMGSQQELAWRYGLMKMMALKATAAEKIIEFAEEDGDAHGILESAETLEEALDEVMRAFAKSEGFDMERADKRADELLRDHLNPFQRVELEIRGLFRIRSASGLMFEIGVGDGFRQVCPVTGRVLVSFCLHPEEWMPAGDVALAIKLQLEDPEREEALLEGARGSLINERAPLRESAVRAWEMERDLIPRQRELVTA